ncbi:MAG: hypothetical protein NTV01_14355 [Bacteroidia bacterium]|nr:hypothetical protein [Bacteroidia bacterium]
MRTLLLRRLVKIVLLFSVPVLFVSGFTGCKKSTEPAELTFTSWRIDDVKEMTA